MRFYVIDHDEQGRSRVSSNPALAMHRLLPANNALSAVRESLSEMPAEAGDGSTIVAKLFESTDRAPFGAVPLAPGRVESMDLPPGAVRWQMVKFGAGVHAHIHETATIDYDHVVAGSVELLLDTGSLRLLAGDAVLLVAARHGWRTEEACTLSTFMTGIERNETSI